MATETDSDRDVPPPLACIARLAARPEAARWARECAWVPGTGYCRQRPCSGACVFQDQRMVEADRLVGARRKRRPSQRPGAHRPEPTPAALLMLRRVLPSVLGYVSSSREESSGPSSVGML